MQQVQDPALALRGLREAARLRQPDARRAGCGSRRSRTRKTVRPRPGQLSSSYSPRQRNADSRPHHRQRAMRRASTGWHREACGRLAMRAPLARPCATAHHNVRPAGHGRATPDSAERRGAAGARRRHLRGAARSGAGAASPSGCAALTRPRAMSRSRCTTPRGALGDTYVMAQEADDGTPTGTRWKRSIASSSCTRIRAARSSCSPGRSWRSMRASRPGRASISARSISASA